MAAPIQAADIDILSAAGKEEVEVAVDKVEVEVGKAEAFVVEQAN